MLGIGTEEFRMRPYEAFIKGHVVCYGNICDECDIALGVRANAACEFDAATGYAGPTTKEHPREG
jgi:hypothetical protein